MVKNSHYLARHLTSPWEFGERQLWHYNVTAGVFGETSSRNLFALDDPYPQHIETLFNKELESPLSAFVQKVIRAPKANPTKHELRALKLAILLQGVRTGTRRRVPDALQDLNDIGQKDRNWFEHMAHAAELVYDFVGLPVRTECLCYPSTGVFPLPVLGTSSGFALPVHPGYLFAAIPKGWATQVFVQISRSAEERDRAVAALSFGTWMADTIVLPPSLRASKPESEMRETIRSSREVAKAIVGRALRFNYRAFGTISPGRPAAVPSRLV